MKPFSLSLAWWAVGAGILCGSLLAAGTNGAGYAVVVSPETWAKPEWAQVARALETKHHGQIVVLRHDEEPMRQGLRQLQPRYACWVAQPEEIDADYVRRIHRVARTLDDDPYEDFVWGIVTGYTAKDAVRLTGGAGGLSVSNLVSLTSLPPGVSANMLVISDQRAGSWRLKEGNMLTNGVGGDSAPLRLLDFLARHELDALVASGHASPFNLELSFRQGTLVCSGNRLYLMEPQEFWSWLAVVGAGKQTGERWYQAPGCALARAQWAAEHAPWELPLPERPKVFLGAGCCLVGNPLRSADSMVVTLLSAGGFNQCVGYTLEPKAAAGGWGTLRLWESLAGSVSLAEACYLANQSVIYDAVRLCPEAAEWLRDEPSIDGKSPQVTAARLRSLAGVPASRRVWLLNALHDLDGLAFYGDPAWEARLDAAGAKVTAAWEAAEGDWRLRLTVRQPGGVTGRFLLRLPARASCPRVVDDAGLDVAVTDEFVVLALRGLAAGREQVIRFARGGAGTTVN